MTAPAPSGHSRKPLGRRLRRYFIVGLVVIAPVGVTIAVLNLVFQTIDGWLGAPIERIVGFPIPGLGFVILALGVLTMGWLVHLAAGRQMLSWWNSQLSKFPVTGLIYNAISQITQSVIGRRRRLFVRTVLIPYPTEGLWAVAFVTNEDTPEMSAAVGEPCVNVFVPTTPNPTSGFMLVVPRSRVKDTGVSIEEAMKLVISAGAVNPYDKPGRVLRRGLDLESLLRDTGEWKDTRG